MLDIEMMPLVLIVMSYVSLYWLSWHRLYDGKLVELMPLWKLETFKFWKWMGGSGRDGSSGSSGSVILHPQLRQMRPLRISSEKKKASLHSGKGRGGRLNHSAVVFTYLSYRHRTNASDALTFFVVWQFLPTAVGFKPGNLGFHVNWLFVVS
jgi:hypothetical protein